MTTIQDRIIGHDDLKDWKVNMRIIMKHGYENVMEEFIEKLLNQKEEETRKETIDKYFLDAEKRLSITNKEKQNGK